MARQANYALPAVSYLEGLHDVPMPPASASARFALSLPLVEPASNAVEPVEWFGRLAGDETKLADRLKERAAAIYPGKRGEMQPASGEAVHASSFKTAEEFWTAAMAGGRWQDDVEAVTLKAVRTPQPPFHLETAATLALVPTAWMGADVSPLMTKLWVESSLKPRMQQVFLHPGTARQLSLEHGARARITSSCGECLVEVALDAAVQPGVLQMAAGQAWFALCESKDGAWRAEVNKVVRA
jgi:anaerobic selenocysteine-containing dehydrogenase